MGYLNAALSSTSQVHAGEGPVSGGGLSQNGKFSYGYASSPGKRSSMEDFYDTRIDGVDGEIVGLFGVFDGHGGARAAEYVKQNLFSNLIRHPKFISDTKSAIADAYSHTNPEFLKSENNQNSDAGSTASTAMLVGDRLPVANVGDSRAVVCRGGNAIAVSRDHKPDQSDERQRIEDAGGFVMWAGTWRVGEVLAVSRALAYLHEKRRVHANLKPSNILLGSDMEPKIGDFGLGRLLTGDTSYKGSGSARNFGSKRSTASRESLLDFAFGPSPSPSSSSLGVSPYHAPESLRSLKPNPKWDVFSFGVILLELLSGKVIIVDELGQGNGLAVEDKTRAMRMADVDEYSESIKLQESVLSDLIKS